MSVLAHIADRVLNRPLLLTRDKAETIVSVLAGRIGVDVSEFSRFEGSPLERDEGTGRVTEKPYNVKDGVAIITITGSMVNRGAWIGAYSGLTSYEGIQHQLRTALADEKVHAAILDLHTPGGEATGCFETAALVRKLAARKRTVALVNGLACSGGYLIASGASEIVSTESGDCGSIGVVRLHVDRSQQLAKDGMKPTLIFAGAHKVDGNPFEPLPDSVREEWEQEVSQLYGMFVDAVAAGRGARMSADAVRATEARIYMGRGAVEVGLADRIGTFDEVLAELSRAPAGRTIVQQRRTSMDTMTGQPAADAGVTEAQLDAAVKAAREEGYQAGVKAENARILGIEANALQGHEALIAAHKADLSMTPEKSALAILAAEKTKPSDVRAGLAALDKAAEGVTSTVSETGASGSSAAPKASTPEGWKAEYEASEQLQAEYPTAEAYVATMKREALRGA